jgi:hypothetical protein
MNKEGVEGDVGRIHIECRLTRGGIIDGGQREDKDGSTIGVE